MKVREFPDGSHQFLPEPGDEEYPVAPVLPPKSPALLALEANEAAIAASDDVRLKVALAEAKELRKREEEQHQANVANFEKTKPPASHPGSPAGARVLSAADKAKQPWRLSADEQERLGIVAKGKAARAKVQE